MQIAIGHFIVLLLVLALPAAGLLKLISWLLDHKAMWTAAVLYCAFLSYLFASTYHYCEEKPQFVSPACDDSDRCGEGKMIFNCDGPGIPLTDATIHLAIPFAAILTLGFALLLGNLKLGTKLEN